VRTLYIRLPDGAVERLVELAAREFREPKAQAGVLILEGLRRAGLDPEQHFAETAGTARKPDSRS
jgi:hypothetical protein